MKPSPLRPEEQVGDPAVQLPGSGSFFSRDLLYALVLAVPLVASAIFAPLLTRALGASEFGSISAAISLNQLFVAGALIGLDQAVLVQRGEDGNSTAARGLVASAFVAVSVTMGLALLTSHWWLPVFGFENRQLGLLALAWTAPNALVVMMTTLLLAEKRFVPFAVLNLASTVGGQVISLILVLVGVPSATTYVWGMAAVATVSTVLGMGLVRPRWSGLRDVATTRRALALGIPLAMNAVAGYVLNAGDRIVIQSLLTPADVGRYQAAYLIGNAVILVLYALGQSWTPRLVELRDPRDRMAVHAHSRNSLYLILAPAVLGVSLAAPWGLRVLAPSSFEPETLTVVVALIAVAAFPVAAGGASGRELLTLRRGRAIAATTMGTALVNVGLNIILLPRIGIAGAALATLLSFMLQAGSKLLLLPKEPRWPRTPWRVWAVVAVAVAAALASTLVPDTRTTMAVRFVLGLLCLPWMVLELRRARI